MKFTPLSPIVSPLQFPSFMSPLNGNTSSSSPLRSQRFNSPAIIFSSPPSILRKRKPITSVSPRTQSPSLAVLGSPFSQFKRPFRCFSPSDLHPVMAGESPMAAGTMDTEIHGQEDSVAKESEERSEPT